MSADVPVVGAVAVGGAAGALARAVVEVVAGVQAGAFPWPVLLINVVGSFGLGALTVLVLARHVPRWVAPALGTGFFGGFTTFSGYVVASEVLLQSGSAALAVVYGLLTPVLCIAAAAAGAQMVRVASALGGGASSPGTQG